MIKRGLFVALYKTSKNACLQGHPGFPEKSLSKLCLQTFWGGLAKFFKWYKTPPFRAEGRRRRRVQGFALRFNTLYKPTSEGTRENLFSHDRARKAYTGFKTPPLSPQKSSKCNLLYLIFGDPAWGGKPPRAAGSGLCPEV